MGESQLRIHVLGPLEVLADGVRVELPPSRKARALLGYLVATDRAHPRSALCDLLWQDVSDPRAGLRWALSKLRSAIDTDERSVLSAFRSRVGFDSTAAEVDLHQLRTLVSDDPAKLPVTTLGTAATLFRGEFLEGLDIQRCHEYETWCMGRRERLRQLRLSILAALAERHRDDPEEALRHAMLRLTLDPFAEDAYTVAMELLGVLGRVDRALELYDRCRRMLDTTFGARPSAEMESARRRLRQRPPAGRSVEDDGHGRPPDVRTRSSEVGGPEDLAQALVQLPEPGHLPAPDRNDAPLVGRDAEMEALADFLRRRPSEGTPPAILLSGEAGIGKTRLLREMVRAARAADGWVLSGPIFETEELRPYGPMIDILRGIPPGAVDPEIRNGLSTLLSGPGSERRTDGPTERAQLFEAAARLLRQAAKAQGPALIVLDDVQWLDGSSISLLHYLVRTLASTPLAYALAARGVEVEPGSGVARMLRSLEEVGHLRRLHLERLDEWETGILVRTVDPELNPQGVFAASEGNPLFTLALATSLRDGVERTPSTIEEELRARLQRPEPRARALLPWAAALGRAFDVPTLVQVIDAPDHEVVEGIASLERWGILRATGEDRFDFTHSLLRQTAYRQPSEPVRRQIHRSIAGTLDEGSTAEGRTPGVVAQHAELGGLPALAARAYAEAADDSLWVFAFDQADEMLQRGLAQVAKLPDAVRIPLEMRLLQLYGYRSMRNHRPAGIEAEVTRVKEEAGRLGMTQVVAKGHASLMELEYQRGAYDDAGRSSLRSAEAGRHAEPGAAARSLAETAACLLLLDRDPRDARRLANEAFGVARERGLEASVLALARALLQHHDGELGSASRWFEDVIRLGRRTKDRWWEHPAMTRMVMVELDRRRPERARALARETEELAERIDDQVAAAFARGLGAVAAAQARSDDGEAMADDIHLEAVDAALAELRELDSLWRIGHIQAYAAELELGRNRSEAARDRAREALEAGLTLERPSLSALARALLAHASALEGDAKGASNHLDTPEITHPLHDLSHRARRGIKRAREAVQAAAG